MRFPFVLLLLITVSTLTFGQNTIEIGHRVTIQSDVLKEGRSVQVYLPASYFFSDKGNYPVIYLMDGDYNFHYDTGLIELLSTVSERIPEAIVVGISDKGSEQYRNNCKPTNGSEKSGNADIFMSFIEDELKPYINKNYRTSDYNMLIGHSIGGLFVTNYLLEKSSAFDTYIAIEPALWWDEYEIIGRADSVFRNKENLDAEFFISRTDMKGMGITQFAGILDKHFPDQEKWHFEHYKNENHNSVGLITIKTALEELFNEWEITRNIFSSFENASQFVAHFKELNAKFKTSFALPVGVLGNVMYYYRDNEVELNNLESAIKEDFPASLDEFYIQKALLHFEKDELKEAQNIYEVNIKRNPDSFKSYDGLSKVYLAREDYAKAKAMSDQALEIAKNLQARQWMLNELQANNEKIYGKSGK